MVRQRSRHSRFLQDEFLSGEDGRVDRQADVIIAGAAIIGLSIAYQPARRSPARILVLEKGAGLGGGSTGASSAVCRFKYSNQAMVELARDSIAIYQHWSEFLHTSSPNAQYHRIGVVWLDGSPSHAVQESARLSG